MRVVNRSALVVRPKEPYIEWAAGLDDEAPREVESMRDHCSVYLVAPDPRGEQESAPIELYFEWIFEVELGGWHTDPDDWPEPRDLRTFHEWFDVKAQSIVFDLEDTALRVEEI